ncbi:FAD-dependent tricarballylate dehydrogenase TcuA [Szabonella alba]|uniref:FAD-dependent tricarballylate dehydrogenase TcuA n=1 Tax=Szabonella alba TaxID=2804194 RepID=A0A8K0VBW5_9RHOB|nr:FAD-dependent tricarballylate dehydrogenase TcuA [Szabonella alba]MBL4919237.1 FAD-dependent tricarballylate dehydrogenase TcuA [Szabonella alba]
MIPQETDVVVVGAGNAALCAALSAAETGARVLVLERAPEPEAGGNSRFTAGAIKCVYDGVDDLRRLMPDLSESEIAMTDFGEHPESRFYDDMGRQTQYRADPDLTEVLVTQSRDTMLWMRDKGVRFLPMYGRQAFKHEGRFRFWGGLTVEAHGGGPGLVAALVKAVTAVGVPILYDTRATDLLAGDDGVRGVRVRHKGRTHEIRARSVVLASGGFEANAEWRTKYLGPDWELAKVRGTRFNTGDGHRMAMDIGAMPTGNWSGCHATGWDRNAPEFGDLVVGDNFQKHSYPFGIMLNANGERFVDEGADVFSYTYAKYGREVLRQPGQFAWQIFDAKSQKFLRDEYRFRGMTRVRADTLEDLVGKLADVDAVRALETIHAFNAAVEEDRAFDPNIKDGRRTRGLAIDKTNWAQPLDEGPFEAYAVTCGITFTFGGIRITPSAEVVDTDGAVIDGLFAAGEIVGGLFYFNYPSGTGLMSGAVFGRVAGRQAGQRVLPTEHRQAG